MTNEPTEQSAPKPAPKPAAKPTAKPTAKQAQADKDRLRKERGAGVPAEDIEFDVDEDAGTVTTTVGGVGWPEGAENEEGTQADGTVRKDDDD